MKPVANAGMLAGVAPVYVARVTIMFVASKAPKCRPDPLATVSPPDWCANWAALRSARALSSGNRRTVATAPLGDVRTLSPACCSQVAGRRPASAVLPRRGRRRERGRVQLIGLAGQDAGEGAREEERKKRRIAR
jgi:hypothetical protein